MKNNLETTSKQVERQNKKGNEKNTKKGSGLKKKKRSTKRIPHR